MSDTSPPERFVDAARRYRIDSRIATGGMGEVWRGVDTVLGRPVAVKLLKSEYADDATFRSRFESEARHAASLHHPNVCAVYDVGESAATDGSGQPVPFLVMELVEGQPLSALLRGGRKLDPVVMRDLLAQAADGIGAAHRAGIVHRDVKPANLMVTPDRTIKITDFGIARASDGLGLTGTGQVMGTPQYLSPEQARGNPATSASDVYSLGVVAWECLAGYRPFEKQSPVATALAHLNDPVPPLPDSVPSDLAIVVERALAKDPAQRYADGSALAAALRDPATAATQLGVLPLVVPIAGPTAVPEDSTRVMSAVPPTPPRTAPRPVTPVDLAAPIDPPVERSSPWWIFAAIVVIGILAVVLVLQLTGGSDSSDSGDSGDTASTTPPPTEASSSAPTPSPTAEDSPTAEPEPETFSIDEGDYLGDDVDDVVDRLSERGLQVDVDEIDNPGGEDAGAVESITPTRDLSDGDTVKVRYYGEEPAPDPEPTPAPTPTQAPPASSPPASQGSDQSGTQSTGSSPSASGRLGASPGRPGPAPGVGGGPR